MFKNIYRYFLAFSSLNLILPINSTLSQREDFDPEHLCPLIAYGTKIKDPRYCNVHIECRNETSVSYACAGDLWYDRNTGECVEPESIKCVSSQPCLGKNDTFTADPYSCHGYYYCLNGKGSLGYCTNGRNFNPNTMNCVDNFSCSIGILPEDYCNIVPEGVFIRVPNTCRDYQTCWQSVLYNGSCSEGFHFNAYKGICDLPKNVDCGNKKPEIPQDVKCYSDGVFIPDGGTCNGYYYCSGKATGEFDKLHGKCPEGRFFDAHDGGQCLPRTNVSCSYDRCVTKGMSQIEMVNVQGDGCRGYAICQHGVEIGRNVCPEGKYFDEAIQLCVNEEIRYVACAIEDGETTSSTTTTTTTTTTVMPSTSTTTTTTTPLPTTTTPLPTTTTTVLPTSTSEPASTTTIAPSTFVSVTSTPSPTSFRKSPTTPPPNPPIDRSQYIFVPTIEY